MPLEPKIDWRSENLARVYHQFFPESRITRHLNQLEERGVGEDDQIQLSSDEDTVRFQIEPIGALCRLCEEAAPTGTGEWYVRVHCNRCIEQLDMEWDD